MPIEAPVEPHIQPPVTALIEAIPAAVDVLRPEARDLVAAFAGRWQAMDEAIEVLREVAPSTALAVMEAAPSTAAGRLSGPILFFLTAIRAGDARGWLGDKALEVLVQSGRSDLLQRIEEDFARINRVAVETSGNDWRPIILPVHDGQGFNPLFLFLRQHFTGDNRGGDAGQNDEDASGTRFVMDINLKRLGRLQLDGLVAGARFDLIVRSAQPFSTQIRTSILEMFENSNSATGLSGNIVFESGGPIPQTPFASFATDQNKPHTQNMLA